MPLYLSLIVLFITLVLLRNKQREEKLKKLVTKLAKEQHERN